MSFSVTFGLAEAQLDGLVLGPRGRQGFLRMGEVRVGRQQRLDTLDLVAQLSLPLDQPHVSEEKLRGLHSRTTRTWPSLTTSPSFTRTSLTVPARGAVTGISIFIDSRMSSSSSSATWAPGAVFTFQTLPTSSALTSVIYPKPRILRASSIEATAWPRSRARRAAFSTSSPLLFAIRPSSR